MRALPIIVAAGLLAGCRHQAYRWNVESHTARYRDPIELDATDDCATADAVPSQGENGGHVERCVAGGHELFRLAYVEIDDQGRLWEPEQLSTALDALAKGRTAESATVVVYVHGWEHDAAHNDQNVRNFRRVLYRRAIARREHDHAVIGLYIGWRGRTTDIRTPFSFWARRKGARRVGDRHGATVFDALSDEIRRWRDEDRAAGREDRTRALVVGHSFGAAVTHSALEHSLRQQLSADASAPRQLEYDLVALINPAFEAPSFEPLHAAGALRKDERVATPVVVATTEFDCNTRRHFRSALVVGARGNGLFRDDAGVMFTRAERYRSVGHARWPGQYTNNVISCVQDTSRRPSPPRPFEPFEPTVPRAAYDGRDGKRMVEACCVRVRAHNDVCELSVPVQPVTMIYDREGELMDYHSHVFSDSLWTMLWGMLDRH